jgi:choline dehydrogenase-like flavoprotein
VAALRLTEKGYRVAVLEAGQRFDDPSRDAGRCGRCAAGRVRCAVLAGGPEWARYGGVP